MNRALLVVLGLLLILLIGAGTYALFFRHAVPVTQEPGTTLPSGQNVIPSGTEGHTIVVAATGGSSVTTNDFVNNGVTFEDPANKGDYYIAGTNGVCTPEGNCPSAGNVLGFNIKYSSFDSSFVVGLTGEPLGENRKKAEQYLMQALGISENDMCRLNYTVITTTYISQVYGGENLGFSFCPGATKLP